MDDILGKAFQDMAGLSFSCSCGRQHNVGIQRFLIGNGIEKAIAAYISEVTGGTVLLISDNNTYKAYGERLYNAFTGQGIKTRPFILKSEGQLVPDERTLGRLVIEIGDDISLIVAAGSGTLNDLSRFLSKKFKIPYMIAGTAPSMDGYASVVSPLIVDGTKVTYNAVYPCAIAADLDVLKAAPAEMVHAGYGDIIGKITALADWELSRRLNGEYYCETSVKLVHNAMKKCADNAEGIGARDEKAIGYLMEALILSGIAIGLAGSSRPASGSEHHLAHYWEVSALSRGVEHPLHGNSVGVGAVISASVYEMMGDYLPEGFRKPDRQQIVDLLRLAGACDNPAELGIEKEIFRQSVLHALEIRERYTILSFASKNGKLPEIADILTKRFYN